MVQLVLIPRLLMARLGLPDPERSETGFMP
jgi:hypothetical protein